MKRLMFVILMTFLLLIVGCAKDEIVAPGDEVTPNQSDEQVEHEVGNQDPNGGQEEVEETTPNDEVGDETENAEGSKEIKEAGKQTNQETSKKEKSSQAKPDQQSQQNKQTSNKGAQDKPDTTTEMKETPKQPEDKKKEESPPKQDPPKEPAVPKQTVTITIIAPDVKGTILPVTTVEMEDGDTVLTITEKIVRARGIQMSVRGANATAYVEGIDNLYEFDHGPLSGWEVLVDGKTLDRSAGVYGIKAGQAIKWRYTTNYTE